MGIIFIWFLGLFISIYIGHQVVKPINQRLRRYIGVEQAGNKLTPIIGYIERAIYTILFYNGEHNIIAALFGIMIAQRLLANTKLEKPKKDGVTLFQETGERINVYFISNFASLFFGILGGYVVKYFLNK